MTCYLPQDVTAKLDAAMGKWTAAHRQQYAADSGPELQQQQQQCAASSGPEQQQQEQQLQEQQQQRAMPEQGSSSGFAVPPREEMAAATFAYAFGTYVYDEEVAAALKSAFNTAFADKLTQLPACPSSSTDPVSDFSALCQFMHTVVELVGSTHVQGLAAERYCAQRFDQQEKSIAQLQAGQDQLLAGQQQILQQLQHLSEGQSIHMLSSSSMQHQLQAQDQKWCAVQQQMGVISSNVLRIVPGQGCTGKDHKQHKQREAWQSQQDSKRQQRSLQQQVGFGEQDIRERGTRVCGETECDEDQQDKQQQEHQEQQQQQQHKKWPGSCPTPSGELMQQAIPVYAWI